MASLPFSSHARLLRCSPTSPFPMLPMARARTLSFTPLRSKFSSFPRIYAFSSNDIKVGSNIEVDGAPWRVLEFLHVKPGKGAAFVRTKVRNYITGNTVEKTFRAGSTIQEANIAKETKQFTYKDGSQFVFMDLLPSSLVAPAPAVARHSCACRRSPLLRPPSLVACRSSCRRCSLLQLSPSLVAPGPVAIVACFTRFNCCRRTPHPLELSPSLATPTAATYEETRLTEAEVGEKTKWLKEGMDCNVVFWNGRVRRISNVGMNKIQIAGGSKPATLDT
ncbi:elongation factor P, partial [Musa troglodytarum]